ncbi:MAG: MBL fold metallo-hydrolase [Candidatus Eisenbacteria bacterium]|nr:MBL fold metallo-hydrolase [Candidatus Latescibacterota bacterium]MBD3303444.1 MBL fold metallo-hydrolase [Candidatus Eisenbacteria bacterium]
MRTPTGNGRPEASAPPARSSTASPSRSSAVSLTLRALASGSSGNATLVSGRDATILVDCGTSARELTARLYACGIDPRSLDAILITHAHVDHYRAAGTMNRRFGIPVHVDPSTARSLAHCGRNSSWRQLRETRPIPGRIGAIEITPIDVPHGEPGRTGRTVAFHFESDRVRAAVVTDLGTVPEAGLSRLRGVDGLILEANYDEETVRRKLADPRFLHDHHYLSWVASDRGHLSNRQCAEAIATIATEATHHVILGHLSTNHPDSARDNNDPRNALETVRGILRRQRVRAPELTIAPRLGALEAPPGPPVTLGSARRSIPLGNPLQRKWERKMPTTRG